MSRDVFVVCYEFDGVARGRKSHASIVGHAKTKRIRASKAYPEIANLRTGANRQHLVGFITATNPTSVVRRRPASRNHELPQRDARPSHGRDRSKIELNHGVEVTGGRIVVSKERGRSASGKRVQRPS